MPCDSFRTTSISLTPFLMGSELTFPSRTLSFRGRARIADCCQLFTDRNSLGRALEFEIFRGRDSVPQNREITSLVALQNRGLERVCMLAVDLDVLDTVDAMGGGNQAHTFEEEGGALALPSMVDNPHCAVANFGWSRRHLNRAHGEAAVERTVMLRTTGSDRPLMSGRKEILP